MQEHVKPLIASLNDAKVKSSVENGLLHFSKITNVVDLLQLQDSLTEEERKKYTLRDEKILQNIINKGIFIGCYTKNNQLVGQIALNPENKPGYMNPKNDLIVKFLLDKKIYELEAALVKKEFRGHGLMEKMSRMAEEYLCNGECKAIIEVAGCASNNMPSAMSILKNGFSLCSFTSYEPNKDSKKVIAYGFEKIPGHDYKAFKSNVFSNSDPSLLKNPEKVKDIIENGDVINLENNKLIITHPIGLKEEVESKLLQSELKAINCSVDIFNNTISSQIIQLE